MELGLSAKQETQPEGVRYDKVMEAFGGHGEHVERPEDLRPAVERSLASGKASLVNVVINKQPARKKQIHHWMGRESRMEY